MLLKLRIRNSDEAQQIRGLITHLGLNEKEFLIYCINKGMESLMKNKETTDVDQTEARQDT